MANDRRSSSGSTLSSPFESPTFDQDLSLTVPSDVGAASISPSGRDVVLASKEGLYIIDLDAQYQPPRHIPNRSQWEVADVQWSPFAARDSWIVSTSNQKAIVWNLQLPGPNIPIEHVLHAHNGAITDINFSAHHPDLLATCGVDSFVICWDLRQRQNAVQNFSGKEAASTVYGAVAKFAAWDSGATQVKWNRQDSNIVASSHGRFLHIWDRRKGAEPLKKIAAHATKVYGLDWNRFNPTGILTCGLDKTIKIWDYSLCGPGENPQPERIIHTPYPVWRARHTPFGSGVLAMPQRGNTDLHLYDLRLDYMHPIDCRLDPVHSFEEHTDNVKEFLWRSRGGVDEDRIDNREFQLISWGRDEKLRFHKINPDILRSVRHERGRKTYDNIRQTRKDAIYRTYSTEQVRRAPPRPNSAETTDQPKSHLTALFHPTSPPGNSAGSIEHFVPLDKDQKTLPAPWPFAGSLSGMQMKSRAKKTTNVITWMKGVRMGKREPTTPSKYGNQTKTPTLQVSKSDMTENLGDEITQVGSKFKKVDFEVADVARRITTVSLNGPWGSDNRPVFVRITLRFPSNYPRDAAPEYKLEKTTSTICDSVLAKMDEEIQSIVDLYKSKRKGSLDAIISYLLGECDLEESISFFSEDNDENGILEVIEESSSDEEDGIGEDIKAQGLEESGADIPGIKNANANVPIPRTSSARWTRDGRLLRIHPPKPEPKPFFSHELLRHSEKSFRAPRLFDAFGRFKTSSPNPEKKSSHDDDNEEVDSEWETASSSSSEDSSTNLGGLTGPFAAPAGWQGTSIRFKTSQHSSAGYPAKEITPKSDSILTMYDLTHMVPSNRSLAEEYEICGDGPNVCENNAEVARSHGNSDIADIWSLVGMILANSVPLELMPQPHRREPILVVARRAMVRIKRKDSGLDLAFDEADSVLRPVLKSRVKWGHHPLASSWLIPALFDHFEKLADIQMLAMLSCVFSEPAAREGVPNALLGLKQSELPMSMQAPAFSLDYFSSQATAWSLFQPTISIPSTPTVNYGRNSRAVSHWEDKFTKKTNLDVFGSTGSSNGPWGSAVVSDPVTPYSTGATPPVLSRASTFRSSANASFSTSPEQTFTRRSNANLANAFATLSRTFISASPPSQSKSRTAGGEGDLSTSVPNSVTWGTNTFYSNSSAATSNTHRSNQSKKRYSSSGWQADGALDEVDEYEGDEDVIYSEDGVSTPAIVAPSNEAAYKVTLKNQDQFDDEACVSSSLLAHVETWKLVQYREQYANQLLLWGLPIQRSEVLKFNGLHSYWEPEEDPRSLHFEFGKKYQTSSRATLVNGKSPARSDHMGSRMSIMGSGFTIPSPKKFRFNPEADDFVPIGWEINEKAQMETGELVSHHAANSSVGSSLTVTLTPAPDSTALPTELERALLKAGLPIEGHEVATTTFPYCNTCLLKVERLYSIFEQCGHIAHLSCMDQENELGMCKIGCGCLCEEDM